VARAAVPQPGFRTKVYYLEFFQSNQLVSLAANAPENSTIYLGPGDFATADSIYPARKGIRIIGQGREVTRIFGVDGGYGAAYIFGTNSVLANLTIQAHIPLASFEAITNALVENVTIRGAVDCQFSTGDSHTAPTDILRFKNCQFYSGLDFIMIQMASPLARTTIEDSYFFADSLLDTAGEYPGRVPHVFFVTQGTLNLRNCSVWFTNALNAQTFVFADATFNCTNCVRGVFDGVTIYGAVTNGGTMFQPYVFNNSGGGTNSILHYRNTPQVPIYTNATIYTSLYGPSLVIHTGDPGSAINPGLTNWLPNIGWGGVPDRYCFELTIKDGTGRATGTNISIRPLGGSTIDGAANILLNVNHGSVTVRPRPGTTNWMVVSRGQ
jgi:hypothetical protein